MQIICGKFMKPIWYLVCDPQLNTLLSNGLFLAHQNTCIWYLKTFHSFLSHRGVFSLFPPRLAPSFPFIPPVTPPSVLPLQIDRNNNKFFRLHNMLIENGIIICTHRLGKGGAMRTVSRSNQRFRKASANYYRIWFRKTRIS